MTAEDNKSNPGAFEPIKGMVEISDKPDLSRTAVAKGTILLSEISISHIVNNTNPKGDVLENAKLAAIVAVKKTPDLVFMCHPIRLTAVNVDFIIRKKEIDVEVTVRTIDKTGVEIEALAGVFNALLAIFDLSKRFEKDDQGQYPTARIIGAKVINKTKEEFN